MYYDLVSRMHHDAGATISTIAVGQRRQRRSAAGDREVRRRFLLSDRQPAQPAGAFCRGFSRHGGEVTMVEKEFTPHSENPDAVLKDLAPRQMPPLLGYVSTEIKPRATMDMYVERTDSREPVIASWRYGAGKVMAVTTDASGRWSGTWVSTNVFAPLWDRLLTWMTPEMPAEPKIDVALGYNAGTHQHETHRLQRRARQRGAARHRAGNAARRDPHRNRAHRGSRRRAVGIDRRSCARELLLRSALARRARTRNFRRSHSPSARR